MLAKILASTSTFNGVSYNTKKIDKTTGELMAIKNFGVLSDDLSLNPEEVKNYLKMHSLMNPKLKESQFHAMISSKGREDSKEKLTEVGHEWMKRMGYGDNPYIIVFHSDTENNHIHLISSRVGINGKTISSSNERYRSKDVLQDILNNNVQAIPNDLSKFLNYKFSSLKQFQTILECAGYNSIVNESSLDIFKGKTYLESYSVNELDQKYRTDFNQNRKNQIKALVAKYSILHDTTLIPVHQKLSGDRQGKVISYKSDFTENMKKKFGFEFVFHFSGDKKPYGYTFIDHKDQQVYKGSDIIKLQELLEKSSINSQVDIIDDSNSFDYTQQSATNNPIPISSTIESAIDFVTSTLFLDVGSDVDDEKAHGRERKKGKKR